jgi:hypothetical protein
MNKIHANALFYIYFIALTYAFATDVKILSEPAAFDAEHPIVSSILLFLTKYGLSGGVLRTYFGSLVAVYAATHIATSIDNGVGIKSSIFRILPLIAFHCFTSFSFLKFLGWEKLSSHFLLALFFVLIIPLFIFITLKGIARIKFDNDKKIDGIYIYHFYWLVFPIYYYTVRIINEYLLAVEMLKYASQINFFGGIFLAISAISFIAYVIPITIVFKILKGEILSNASKVIIAICNAGIIILGYLIAGSIANGIDWLKEYFKFLYA